jgi:hypothetical protein
MNGRKLVALAGFIVLGLSPSFIDWQQSPERHTEFLAYYGIALALLYAGLD